ncbi:hypothetical protein N7488_004234 [Penicillium malachiteum]|nr:hypothetical protein N7488_004234 [Penicillium malachiteum]
MSASCRYKQNLAYQRLIEPERRQWRWLNFVAFWIADSLNVVGSTTFYPHFMSSPDRFWRRKSETNRIMFFP